MTNAITVPFHGNTLFVVEHGGQPYTPMKPIVEGMGLDWKSQYTKIKQRFASSVVEITMQLPGDTQNRAITCLSMRKLPGWLMTINPSKVKAERRGPAAIRLWASLKTRFGCACKRLCRLTRAARVRYLRRRSFEPPSGGNATRQTRRIFLPKIHGPAFAAVVFPEIANTGSLS